MIDPSTYGMVAKRTPAQCALQAKLTHTGGTSAAWDVVLDISGRGVLHIVKAGARDANTQNKIRLTIDGRLLFAEAVFDSTSSDYYLQGSFISTVAAGYKELVCVFGQSLKIESYRSGANAQITDFWYSLGEL